MSGDAAGDDRHRHVRTHRNRLLAANNNDRMLPDDRHVDIEHITSIEQALCAGPTRKMPQLEPGRVLRIWSDMSRSPASP